MKNKAILGLFLAFFAIALVSTIAADDFATIDRVEVNDVVLTSGETYVGHVSDSIPVLVEFTANEDVDNPVTVKTYIEGYSRDIEDSVVARSALREGVKGYTARLSLELPSSMDLDDLEEDLNLIVRFSAKGEDSFEESYEIRMQRDLHSLSVLHIEAPNAVNAGSSIAVDAVVENNGNDRLENVYVKVSIPDLGVQNTVYFGDIDPQDEIENSCDWDDDEDEEDDEDDEDDDNWDDECNNWWKDLNREDTVQKRIYLDIPRTATPGDYNLEVEAYNVDTEILAKKRIVVNAVETGVYTTGSKTVAPGEETTFDVVLVNPSGSVAVYTIAPQESPGLIVEVTEPMVVIPKEDSKTVTVKVKAATSADEGTHVVTLNVNSDGKLVTTKQLTVNVEKSSSAGIGGIGFGGRSDATFVLTVVLVIVFVVLLIILIVLLTKKPAETEEFGETSYY